MSRSRRLNHLAVLFVAAAGLGAVLLAGCGAPQPTPDVQELARNIAAVWATETAQAQALALPTPTPTGSGSALTPPPIPTSAPTAVPPTHTPTTPAPTDTATSPPLMNTPTVTAPPPPPPAPTATPTVTPSLTPTATPTATPLCPIAVSPQLAPAWNPARFGCPRSQAVVNWSSWQPFQYGFMFWRSDLDWTYVLNFAGGTDRTSGPWITGGDNWRWDGSFPEGRGLIPPAGLVEPIRGFGYVWYNFLGGQTGSQGWATDQEQGFCAEIQPFDNGLIFASSTVEYCQDELYNSARDPSFDPILAAIHDDGSWRRY